MARKVKDNPSGKKLVKYAIIGAAAWFGYKALVKK